MEAIESQDVLIWQPKGRGELVSTSRHCRRKTNVPIAQQPSTMEKYLGLTRSGTISQKMTWAMVMTPPPPIPWTPRPARSIRKPWEMAQRTVPTVKKKRETRRSCWRPKSWETEAMIGWATADDSR